MEPPINFVTSPPMPEKYFKPRYRLFYYPAGHESGKPVWACYLWSSEKPAFMKWIFAF